MSAFEREYGSVRLTDAASDQVVVALDTTEGVRESGTRQWTDGHGNVALSADGVLRYDTGYNNRAARYARRGPLYGALVGALAAEEWPPGSGGTLRVYDEDLDADFGSEVTADGTLFLDADAPFDDGYVSRRFG